MGAGMCGAVVTVPGWDSGDSAPQRFLHQVKAECHFSNASGQVQLRYLERFIYDRTEIVRFDSARDRFEALTPLGEPTVKRWNSCKEELQRARATMDLFCWFCYSLPEAGRVLGRRVKPVVTVSPTKDDPLSPRTLLLCTAASFYPREIKIHWLKNGRRATEGVLYGEELHNGDWTYQIQVMLEDTPQRGDVYACQVEHASLKTPLIVRWERRTSASARSKVWTGVTGALLGMVYLAVGLSLYLRSKKGKGALEGTLGGRPREGDASPALSEVLLDSVWFPFYEGGVTLDSRSWAFPKSKAGSRGCRGTLEGGPQRHCPLSP
uniref:Ig-like domain-containing protein n=1 Tax=Varanus komodoensis TaxID=61221 RepID=A0A8D2L7V7_VARKO